MERICEKMKTELKAEPYTMKGNNSLLTEEGKLTIDQFCAECELQMEFVQNILNMKGIDTESLRLEMDQNLKHLQSLLVMENVKRSRKSVIMSAAASVVFSVVGSIIGGAVFGPVGVAVGAAAGSAPAAAVLLMTKSKMDIVPKHSPLVTYEAAVTQMVNCLAQMQKLVDDACPSSQQK